MRHNSGVAGLLLLLGLAFGCSKEYTLDPLTLTEEARVILGALREDPIFPLEAPPEVRIATRAELAAALYGEILPVVRRLGLDGSRAESLAREQSQGLSRLVGAKYFSGPQAVLVVPQNVAQAASGLGRAGAGTRELLRGLLLLECCHALGVRRFGTDRTGAETEDVDRAMTRRAVVEGFARFLARRIARTARVGPPELEASLDLCTEMIVGRPPEAIRSAEDAVADQAYRQLSFIHEQGERFVTAVFENGGEPAIRELLKNPPDDPDLVARPQWFLDPATRPLPTRDLERALTLFEERFDPELWNRQRVDETRQRIETQLALSDQQNLERIVNGIVAARTSVMTARSEPEKNNVSLQIKEHTTAAEAEFFVGHVRRIIESDRTENVREIAAEDGQWRGILFSQSAQAPGGVKILGGVVALGVLTVSVSFTGEMALEPSLMEILRTVVREL